MAINYSMAAAIPRSGAKQLGEEAINTRLSPIASSATFANNTVSRTGRGTGANKSGTAPAPTNSAGPKTPKFKKVTGTTKESFNDNLSDQMNKSATMASTMQAGSVIQQRNDRQAKYQEQLADWEKRQRDKSIAEMEAANRQLEKLGKGVTIEGTGPSADGQMVPVAKVAKGTRQDIVDAAYSLLGTTYSYGGGGYGSAKSYGNARGDQNVIGIDCSGLTSFAYYQVGITIPRKSTSQVAAGHRTSVRNAKPGDIIGWYNGDGSVMAHVAIYAGNGKIIEANSVTGKVVHHNIWSAGSAFAVSLGV